MSHPNETILKTVRDILRNGNTLAKDSIYIDKMIHPDDICLPQVIIYTNSESIELFDQAPRRQKRVMTMHIEVLYATPTEQENSDNLKQLVWQIETLLSDDDDWNGTISRNFLNAERYEYREQGNIPIGHCQIAYLVEYFTELPGDVLTQVAANATDLDKLEGLATGDPSTTKGWDLVGDPGAPQPGDVDNEVEAELLIDYT